MNTFDDTKFYLGKLCKRNHDYDNTGYSLRYIGDRTCILCCKERKSKKCNILIETLIEARNEELMKE